MITFRRVRDYLAAHRRSDLALMVAVSLLATRGWFNLQIPEGHDTLADTLLAQASTHTVSLQGLLSGWSDSWFLGTPLFYVHAPLVSSLIKGLSYVVGWVAAMKLLYLCFYVFSGVFAYLYVYELTRSRCASFAAGLAYVFLPYHVLEVAFEGHHGAFGLPYMLTPLLFLSLEKLIKEPRFNYVILNGFLLAALILTYPQVFPFLIGPFYVLYAALRVLRGRQQGSRHVKIASAATAGALCLSLLLTAFWWLPSIADVRYYAAKSFPLEASREYSATLLQAITLRPAFCCAPSSAFGASSSILTDTLRLVPFLMILTGVLLNRRSWYVWFFFGSLVLAIFLSMGPDSPIKLFTLAYRLVPFFSGLRTPWRFLLFASLAYAVLIGFFVGAAVQWMRSRPLARLRAETATASLLLLAVLILLGNTWQETRSAFGTFALTDEQQDAYDWLEGQADSDYRITDLPFRTWTSDSEGRWVINPTHWTWLHGKEDVYGGVPAAALVYAGDILEILNYSYEQGANPDEWLRLFNVRYVLCNRGGADADRIELGGRYSLGWSGESLVIYETSASMPRIFTVSYAERRDIPAGDVSSADLETSGAVSISFDNTHTRSTSPSLAALFRFTEADQERSILCADVSDMALDGDDTICLGFYSERALPDMCITIDAVESDGSRYGMDLRVVDGVQAGWNDVEFPLSLLLLRESTDEDSTLDPGDVADIWFGVRKHDNLDRQHEFTLFFDTLAVVSASTNTDVQYAKTGTANYAVHVNAQSPSRLILSESYHPGWRARVGGASVGSVISYESLNGFELPAGEYDVILEFSPSPLRAAGSIVSNVGLSLILLTATLLLGRSVRRIRLKKQALVLKWHNSTKED